MRAKHWLETIQAQLTDICAQYEKTAPTVATWADELYIRINEEPGAVALTELTMVERFVEEGQWMQPNYAANAVYHMLNRLGRDIVGMAGF